MSNYKEYVAASSRWMARALKAEAKVARVEALADEWERGVNSQGRARRLRAALAEPTDGGQ